MIDLVSSIAMSVTALATCGLFLAAIFQLRGLRHSNISREINQSKKTMDDIALEIKIKLLAEDCDETLINILDKRMKAAEESYLNALDHLAFLILRRHLPEQEWKNEYRRIVYNVVQNYEGMFGAATPYNNLLKLYHRWKI